ncbi:chromosome partitioning protein ParB [Baekduia soli]|uniref:Chromosome partitioning protein ParB n=1 Tax=Baekduia soli TaxID=496014 RepID=A0A5B8U7U5_9ACTN|nr:chromosome partitioning protein ParB [Baekduia soli]QEC48878.1 chromosome partitioning protein ParB [Baekduia soli]
MPPRSTGLAGADAQDDFLRARRRLALSRLRRWLRREPGDIDHILPFDEVVTALGRLQERDTGLKVVPLDAIVGTVDRPKGFDRHFRPTTPHVRARWERIATAMRRGEEMPPVDLYKVGDVYFVRDGHHRVSVSRTLGLDVIEAHVVEVLTRVGAGSDLLRADLPLKSHERIFFERVPLPDHARGRVRPSDPWDFAVLAEAIEAWGWRWTQEHEQTMDRRELARRWYEEEYIPVVTMLRDADMLGDGSEADAYLRVGGERYRLLRTHAWNEDVLALLRAARRGS